MAERLYYDTKDIMNVLKVGKRKANEIMHMFDERGELFRHGRTMRVRKTYFEAWLNRIDGSECRKKVLEKDFHRTVPISSNVRAACAKKARNPV